MNFYVYHTKIHALTCTTDVFMSLYPTLQGVNHIRVSLSCHIGVHASYDPTMDLSHPLEILNLYTFLIKKESELA